MTYKPKVLEVAAGGTGASTLTGLVTGNGTSAITATAITQYNVITGGASNAPNSVAPSATTGQPLISQGSSAQPIFSTLSPAVILGVTSGSAPSAGYLGEYISSVVTGVSINSGTPTSVANISITAGVWDVTVTAQGTSSTNVATAFLIGISTTNNTFAGTGGDQKSQWNATVGNTANQSLSVPSFRVLLSGTVTYYMVAQLNFATGTGAIAGRISATRVG